MHTLKFSYFTDNKQFIYSFIQLFFIVKLQFIILYYHKLL